MRRSVMLPLSGGPSTLQEKRKQIFDWLSFSDVATQVGDKNFASTSTMLLDDETSHHVNHASDPGDSTLSLADDTTFNMDRLRGLSDTLTMSDFVHVYLLGYTPSGGGSGDTYLDRHTVTANETITIGQPVYISGNNTTNLADADNIATSHVLGLAETNGTANGTMNVLSDGRITQSDWSSVIGSTSLTPGAQYYLSTSAGQLTTTPPSGISDAVVTCGTAVTTTTLDIEINEIAVL